jgi:cytochrome c
MERDMFDTMTMTKVMGGACGALLVFMLGGWAAETIYHGGGSHGEDYAQGYLIEVADADDALAEPEEQVDFAVVMASASAADGEGLWRNCRSCHALDPGVNGVGPSLYGVVNRAVGAEAGFGYSGALVAVAQTWTPENLQAFLENPKGYAPGTAMGYNGMRKVEDRANLIAYLTTVGG